MTQKLNGDQPVTHSDLATVSGEMSSRFDRVDERSDRLESDVADLKHGQNGMKKLLEENNRLLKTFSGLPARVERLERAVFPRG